MHWKHLTSITIPSVQTHTDTHISCVGYQQKTPNPHTELKKTNTHTEHAATRLQSGKYSPLWIAFGNFQSGQKLRGVSRPNTKRKSLERSATNLKHLSPGLPVLLWFCCKYLLSPRSLPQWLWFPLCTSPLEEKTHKTKIQVFSGVRELSYHSEIKHLSVLESQILWSNSYSWIITLRLSICF